MESFKAIFNLEFKRLFNKRSIGLFLLVLLLSLYFVQNGIQNYKNITENQKSFQDFERMRVKQYQNYNQYGTYGFRIFFVPSPLSVFFVNSSTISQLTSNVDSGERLNIYNSFKGKALFTEKAGGFKDFSGIMLLLGSLLVLYFGYEAMLYKDYFRFLSGFSGIGTMFVAAVLSRMLVLVLFFLVSGGLGLMLLKLNGIGLSGTEYLYFMHYLGGLLVMMIFFFCLGTIAGTIRSSFAGFVMVLLSWFVLVFLIPGVVSGITSSRAGNITSNYHLELQKLKRLMGFEKRAFEEVGVTSEENLNSVQRLVESYWHNEFKTIHALEEQLAREMNKNISDFRTLSMLFPSTQYLSASNEISSNGYESFNRFFQYIRSLKASFVRFCLDHRYYSPDSLADTDAELKVEPFIKQNENLFYARSTLPGQLKAGMLLNVIYIFILVIVAYTRFKNSLKL